MSAALRNELERKITRYDSVLQPYAGCNRAKMSPTDSVCIIAATCTLMGIYCSRALIRASGSAITRVQEVRSASFAAAMQIEDRPAALGVPRKMNRSVSLSRSVTNEKPAVTSFDRRRVLWPLTHIPIAGAWRI